MLTKFTKLGSVMMPPTELREALGARLRRFSLSGVDDVLGLASSTDIDQTDLNNVSLPCL
jgi:hypothetical protein